MALRRYNARRRSPKAGTRVTAEPRLSEFPHNDRLRDADPRRAAAAPDPRAGGAGRQGGTRPRARRGGQPGGARRRAARRHRRAAGRRRKGAARGPCRNCPASRGGDARSARLLDGRDHFRRHRSGRDGASRRAGARLPGDSRRTRHDGPRGGRHADRGAVAANRADSGRSRRCRPGRPVPKRGGPVLRRTTAREP